MPASSNSLVQPSDDALVDRARRGDASALTALYRRYVGEVYGYAINNLGNAQDAEDVTSDTFTRVVDALAGYRGDASFRTWLYAIARNQVRDHWRRNGRQHVVPLEEVPVGTGAAPAQAPPDPRWSRLGRAVLAGLPENYRQVLTLRILQGRSVRETAAALATTEGNVKVLQHRALRRAVDIARELEVHDDR
jgi:RNA polymerase sigma factor (sigma-70 family)